MRSLLPVAVGLVVAAAACGGSKHARVLSVAVAPWPGGPGPLVAATRPTAGTTVPLREIERLVPRTLPPNPPQPCRVGAIVEIVVERAGAVSRLDYGPCVRPAAIERVRRALVAAGERGRSAPRSPGGWKAVLQDWFDGRMDRWHSCSAVRASIEHLPADPNELSTVQLDLEAYARAVC
jgi:hypothetical protein